MIDRPAFHAHITVSIRDSDRVLLSMEEEGEERLLTGPALGVVARCINGSLTIDEIAERLSARVSPELVYFAIQALESGGYITSADSGIPASEESYWTLLGVDPNESAKRLRSATVSLTALGKTDGDELSNILSLLHIAISPDAPFRVVLTDDYLHPGLREINHQALECQTAWILAKPVGKTQWLGPIFRPGVTGCWMCLSHRLRENRLASSAYDTKVSRAGLSSTRSAALNLLASEVAKWLATGRNETLAGTVRTIDSSLNTQSHFLTRRPQCTACGSSAPRSESSQRLVLQSQSRNDSVQGGQRTVTAQATLQRLERHVSPITGVVPFIRRVDTELNTSAHVYTALHRRSGAAGKGVTESEAKAACLGEAIERYSSSFQGDEIQIRARMADQSNTVSPASLLHFSDRQYRDREVWNKHHGVFQWVPEPFDTSSEINWTPVWSLTCQQTRYLPTAFCYLRYPGEDRRFFAADSNGCASGNTLEEAILQGLLELIERDSFALWWYTRARRPGVDLHSFEERFSVNGRTAHVLDITSDLGIPAFVAISAFNDGGEIVFGSGAGLLPRIAVRRAVCELNQMLETVLAPGEADTDIRRWLQSETLANHPYLVPDSECRKSLSDYIDLSDQDILKDITMCVEILRRRGMETLVLDMTRSDIGFPAVRVIVPGLRHFWARLAPGRLYDVPVELGWITRRLDEDELNPIPYML